MPVLSRTRLAAVCAALSTVVVAGMAAVTVLAGDRSCDLDGCPSAATAALRAAEVERPCTAPSTTPPGALGVAALRIATDPCATPDRTPRDPRGTGGMATAQVPAP